MWIFEFLIVFAIISVIVAAFFKYLNQSNEASITELEKKFQQLDSTYEHSLAQKLYLANAQNDPIQPKKMMEYAVVMMQPHIQGIFLAIEAMNLYGNDVMMPQTTTAFNNARQHAIVLLKQLYARRQNKENARLTQSEKDEFTTYLVQAMQTDLIRQITLQNDLNPNSPLAQEFPDVHSLKEELKGFSGEKTGLM